MFTNKKQQHFLKKFKQNCRSFSQKFLKMWIKSHLNSLYFLKIYTSITPCEKQKLKKIFLIPYSTMDKLSNYNSLNSLRWIYRSAKIDWTKNPFEYIVPSPSRGVGTIYLFFYHNDIQYAVKILQHASWETTIISSKLLT